MATTKRRLNISLPPALDSAISSIAKRDRVPEATKASELLAFALSLEEDFALESIALMRDKKSVKLIPHNLAWK